MYNLIIIRILISLILLDKINSQCSKDNPIKKNSECVNEYCLESEFKDGICSIDNSIIKIQWLNKIISFGDENTFFFLSIKMSKNNFIFLSFDENENVYIYDLTSAYQKYFNNEKEAYYKINNFNNANYINGVNLKKGENEYILICDINNCALFDFENNIINYQQQSIISQFNNNNDDWPCFQILNINQENKIFFSSLGENIIYYSISNLDNQNLSEIDYLNKTTYEKKIKAKKLSCFVTETNNIICIYLTDEIYSIICLDSLLNLINLFHLEVTI